MIDHYSRTLTLVAAVGSAVAGGVFLAFSTFVMKALRRLPAAQGMSAMQAINRAAPSPIFMTALFGTALVCVALGISAITRIGEDQAVYELVGSALYLVCIVLTIAYHVPRNEALAAVDPDSQGAAAVWSRYLAEWTTWNHVRTLTAVAGSAILTVALRAG
ncbi:MAG: DUF1772 domain-containing protein [Actinomycetota bacterium]|nr:DUF1772 domain-containing protein [Actinomycetota bacterium]